MSSAEALFFHSNSFVTRNDDKLLFFKENEQQIAFQIVGKRALSLPKSPFGGFSVPFNKNDAGNLMSQVVEYFKRKNISELVIKGYPECYAATAFQSQLKALSKFHFKGSAETTQFLLVSKADFRERIYSSEKRYLNKADKQNYVFKEIGLSQLNEAYTLIESCRVNMGYPVTLSLDELTREIQLFPKNYLLFGLYDNKTLIAAAVCIIVNNDILYDFYHGDALRYRKNSPVVALIKGIYEYSFKNSYKILDLGVSTENGVPNIGLYSFKKSLGALPSPKPVYTLLI